MGKNSLKMREDLRDQHDYHYEKKKRKTVNTGVHIPKIEPLTDNQLKTFSAYSQGKNLLLHGVAGTGKTFISLSLALHEIVSQQNYERVIIVRSIVPTREIGFLPGDLGAKIQQYELPYVSICNEITNRGDGYQALKSRKLIEFISTSHIRGITIKNAIVIVDECENLNFHELDSIITRLGENTKIIFCGDYKQSDLVHRTEKDGMLKFIKILYRMESFECIEFNIDDIVRSDLVRDYIITKDEIERP